MQPDADTEPLLVHGQELFLFARRDGGMAPGRLPEVRWGRPVWAREHGDGAVPGAPGDGRRQRADVQPQHSWNVSGTVAHVHGHGTVLRR